MSNLPSSASSSISGLSTISSSASHGTITYMDEMELMNDPKYKQYVKSVDNALKGFEYTSEWADLVNALGKLNKVLQNNTKYSVIPRRFVVGQRLAQCMHPALPSGVHLKALETYDLIFRCIGTDRLVQELSIYSNGLFPLLSHAAINVKPALLEVYQTHFVPLGERLRPALDGFVIAVLPGLEEASDHYSTTEKLLKDVCEGVNKSFFFGAIWRCILNNPSVRLAGVTFVISQFNKKKAIEDQLFIIGNNMETLVKAICCSLLDPNVLVQRAILDLLLAAFPMHNRHLNEADMIHIVTSALTVLLRRDISLNRRLFSWLRNNLDSNPTKPSRKGDQFFEKYSKPILRQSVLLTLSNPNEVIVSSTSNLGDYWPYRLLICLLDRSEIRSLILESSTTDIFRALYLDSRTPVWNVPTNAYSSSSNSTGQRPQVEHMANLIISNIGVEYTWKSILVMFNDSCLSKSSSNQQDAIEQHPLPIEESCVIIEFMIEVAYDSNPDVGSFYLPVILNSLLKSMIELADVLTVEEFKSIIRLSTQITSKLRSLVMDGKSEKKSPSHLRSSVDPGSDALHDIREESESESLPPSLASPDVVGPADHQIFRSTSTTTMTSSSETNSLSSMSLTYSESTMSMASSTVTLTDQPIGVIDNQTPTATKPDLMDTMDNASTETSVYLVKKLFSTFVETRLTDSGHGGSVTSREMLNRFFEKLTDLKTSQNGLNVCCLPVNYEMSNVYSSLCHLILQSSIISKTSSTETDLGYGSGAGNESQLAEWLKYLIVLSTFTQDINCHVSSQPSSPSIKIAYVSISTFLSLVRILKGVTLNLSIQTISKLTKSVSPISSPILEFTSSGSFSKVNDNHENKDDNVDAKGRIVDPFLTSHDLKIIGSSAFYSIVVTSLWEKMSDQFSDLHLETANLLQQIHNLSPDEDTDDRSPSPDCPLSHHPICETVICSSMASTDEVVAYEARKRFCILYNITRDIESRFSPGHSPSGNHSSTPGHSPRTRCLFERREFDRPLFFMLDSLSHKLDIHNSQAVDWLNQLLKAGDVARILEPLLFILLHPDTSRVSVQHVNIQDGSIDGTKDDETAHSAAEDRIYAISSTGGNVIYHVNPEGYNSLKRRVGGGVQSGTTSPIASKILAVTSQGQASQSITKSGSSSKWVTTRFNVQSSDYEVPPSHEANIISGKYTGLKSDLKLTLNPFGSMSSITSVDTLVEDKIDNSESNLESLVSNAKRFDPKRIRPIYGKSKTLPPSAKLSRVTFNKSASTEGVLNESSDASSDTDIVVGTLLEEIVDQVVRSEGKEIDDDLKGDLLVDGEDQDEEEEEEDTQSSTSSSDSSAATTTRGEMASESISLGCSTSRPVSVNQLHSHLLLYSQVYDSRRTLYALTTLWNIISTDPPKVLFAMSTTSISNRLGFRAQELQTLCARHQKSLLGKGFYSDLDTESITSFRSATFLEIIITVCLYYIRSYYPGLPNNRLTDEEISGNQKVRILSAEILRLVLSELIPEIKGKPNFSSYLHDMLMRCRVQKVVLHSLVASVYNLQHKERLSSSKDDTNNNKNPNEVTTSSSEDSFSDTIVHLNEKMNSSGQGFQEDMQKSLLKLLEQLMILEHKSSPNSGQDKEFPTHNRKGSDSKASRIRFQPQMSSLKYVPKVPIPSQAMFLSAIQAALQETSKANLHPNWLQLVEASLPFAGRSLTRLVVCVVCQLCNNLEGLSNLILARKSMTEGQMAETLFVMPPNHVTILLKSLANLCHYCLCDSGTTSGTASPSMSPTPHPVGGQSSVVANAASTGSVISLNPLSTISNIIHVLTSESLESQSATQSRDSMHDPLASTRRTLLTHLPRILAALRNIWKAVTYKKFDESDITVHQPKSSTRRPSSNTSSNVPKDDENVDKGWEVMGNMKDVKLSVLSLLSPISLLHGSHFMGGVAFIWYELRDTKPTRSDSKSSGSITTSTLSSLTGTTPASTSVIPKCSEDQLILVDLIAAVKVLPMDLIIQHVKQVLKTPPQTTHSKKKRVALEVCLLQFFLAYIRHSSDRSQHLYDCWKSLLSLIRDGLNYSSHQPLAQFHLLAILHDFVQAAPLIEDRRDQKDLQDVAQKLLDACTTVAGARLDQTRWLRRNLEVKPGPQDHTSHDDETDGESTEPSSPRLSLDHSRTTFDVTTTNEADTTSSLAKFSVQALNALAEFVAPVLDVVYVSEEKEKVVPLVSKIMLYVTPYLKNHTKHNMPSFMAGSHLLSSITGYTYSRKAWKKEAFDLFLEANFFQMEESCFQYWKVIIDHLMTHDKTTFREFLSRMSVTQSGSLKLFSSKDQENEQRAQLAKRLAFILFCSEKDQYQRYMPDIQEKLIECLRMNQSSPTVQSHILLCFRVLLLRMSHHHLTSLWPFIYTEMVQAFLQIECELSSTPISDFKRSSSGSQLQKMIASDTWSMSSNGGGLFTTNSSGQPSKDAAWLQLYLYACKLLDLAVALPAETLPQFQMYRWAFVGDPFDDGHPSPTSSVAPGTPTLDKKNNLAAISVLSLNVPPSYASIPNHQQDTLSLRLDTRVSKSPSPSPTPSRTSKYLVPSPILPSFSGPFEPHVVRIERTMRLRNSNPDNLSYIEKKPLLTLTSIRSLLDLHPFFQTLVRVTNSSTLTKATPPDSVSVASQPVSIDSNDTSSTTIKPRLTATVSSSIGEDNDIHLSTYLDDILEKDFLEEIPWI